MVKYNKLGNGYCIRRVKNCFNNNISLKRFLSVRVIGKRFCVKFIELLNKLRNLPGNYFGAAFVVALYVEGQERVVQGKP